MKTVNLFKNIMIDCLTKEEILNWANNIFHKDKKQNYVLSINPEKINLFSKNIIPAELISKSSLRIPDGIGIVWAIKKIKKINTPRITGVDLFDDFLNLANNSKKKIFIYHLITIVIHQMTIVIHQMTIVIHLTKNLIQIFLKNINQDI